MRIRARKLGWLFRLLVVVTTVGLAIPALPTKVRSSGKSAGATSRPASQACFALGALSWLGQSALGSPGLPIREEAEFPLAPAHGGLPASGSETADAPGEESSGEESPAESDDLIETMAWSCSSSAQRARAGGSRLRGPTLAYHRGLATSHADGQPASMTRQAPILSASPSRDMPTRLCRFTC